MNDRELLEMAAKAAGMHHHAWCDAWKCMAIDRGVIDGFDRESCWNPLQDDGDALRLAVKLRLGISLPVHKTIQADVVSFIDSSVSVREGGENPYACARRAIVRAASEIGKSMP